MLDTITEVGAYAYYFSSRLSAEYGYISNFEYWYRIAYLVTLLPQDSVFCTYLLSECPRRFIETEEAASKPEVDPERGEARSVSAPPEKVSTDPKDQSSSVEPAEAAPTDEQSGAEDDQIDRFLSETGILGSPWRFHQSDDDFFPSIPHGHLKTADHIKLDAYLGYTYDTKKNNVRLARETKTFIATLWNNEKFRVFALRAIDYYLDRFPGYLGWRVANPRRLPKFRNVR
jgi:hypothetical protein